MDKRIKLENLESEYPEIAHYAKLFNKCDENKPSVIPYNTTSKLTLQLINEFSKFHLKTPENKEWDDHFIQKVDNALLLELANLAVELKLTPLYNLVIDKLGYFFANESLEVIRKTYNIENDLDLQEQEQIRLENNWVNSV